GIKYLVLAASSAAFLLFGMALIYMATGTMSFAALSHALLTSRSPLLLPGAALILVGIGFKLGLVPFHLWTPDVYQGAPAPVGAFIATASKAGVFAVLLRLYLDMGNPDAPRAVVVITVLAIGSMAAGNLLALRQRNLKRLLASSSIAHRGYLLVAFEAAVASPALAEAAVGFYFLAYFITTLGAFGVISAGATQDGEPEMLDDYRGLFWRRPALALVLTLMMFSLAGIPLTAGFIAKFYLVDAGVSAALWLMLLTLVITSVVGLFYYLRVVVTLYATDEEIRLSAPLVRTDAWVLGALTVALIWVGVYPQTFLRLILGLRLR
ncbi:MAG: NADH-quinone oxidoreductase subunit N, partial [Caulobacteraceae bacterium]